MLFDSLSRIKRSSIMTSILLVMVGIVMLMCPGAYINTLVSMLGYAMLIFATERVLHFITGKKVLINYIYLTCALLLGLLGIGVLVFDNIVLTIGLVFGIVLLGDGLFGVINACVYARRAQRKGWWVLVLLSVLMMLSGLVVLINPWWGDPQSLFRIIGWMLLFSSLVSIARVVMIWPIRDGEG